MSVGAGGARGRLIGGGAREGPEGRGITRAGGTRGEREGAAK